MINIFQLAIGIYIKVLPVHQIFDANKQPINTLILVQKDKKKLHFESGVYLNCF